MKKIISLIFFCLCISKGQAQVEGDITIMNVSPNFYEFRLPFLSMNFASTSSNFFADFGGAFKAGSFYADADFRINYANGLEKFLFSIPEPKYNSIYKYESPKAVLVHTGFMIVKKVVNTKVSFHLKSANHTHYYAEADGQKTKFVMLNLGFKKGFDWVTCEGKELKYEGYAPAGFYTPAPEEVRTMMDYEIIEVGISLGSMGYWEAEIKDYGHRRSSLFNRVYLNLLLMTDSEVDPIYYGQYVYNQDQVYVLYDLNNSPRANLGAVIGIVTNNVTGFGIGGSAEIGYYPGIQGDFSSHIGVMIKSTLSLSDLF